MSKEELLKELNSFWRSLAESDKTSGKITSIISGGVAGFVEDKNGNSYYCNARDFKSNKSKLFYACTAFSYLYMAPVAFHSVLVLSRFISFYLFIVFSKISFCAFFDGYRLLVFNIFLFKIIYSANKKAKSYITI